MALALYTFGQFLEPAEHAANAGFHALNDPVMASVDAAPIIPTSNPVFLAMDMTRKLPA